MERKRTTSSMKPLEEQPVVDTTLATEKVRAEVVSIAQIQNLVRLLDRSDVSEVELKRADEGIHLVLRKIKDTSGSAQAVSVISGGNAAGSEAGTEPDKHNVVAPLVGIFHPWLKPRGGILVAVGDSVKVGQLIGTIESLNVFNEIETTVAGRVLEVHVADGQPVEYGQLLVTIEVSEAEGI